MSFRVRKPTWIGLGCLLAVVAAPLAATERADLPAVVAKVNGQEIDRDQFWSLYQSYQRANPDGLGQPGKAQELEQAILERLIDATLLLQEAKRAGIEVEAEEVDAKLEALRATFPNPASFEKAVASGAYDEARLRADLGKDLAIAQLVERRIDQTIGASEDELLDWYDANRSRLIAPEEVRVNQILIQAPPDAELPTKQRARAEIEECQQLVAASGHFAEVARRRSQDPVSAPAGGDLGWFTRGGSDGGRALPEELESAAFALAAGEVSPILTSSQGYHLLYVAERRPQRTYAFEDIRGQIRGSLLEQKRQQRLAELIQSLRAQARIEIYLR
ncbi:MAG TPA: peptidylprolyl isomerase [Acidobacteriota bacterium]